MAEQKRNKGDGLEDGVKHKSITFSMSFLCSGNQSLGSEVVGGRTDGRIGVFRWHLLIAAVTSQYLQLKTRYEPVAGFRLLGVAYM